MADGARAGYTESMPRPRLYLPVFVRITALLLAALGALGLLGLGFLALLDLNGRGALLPMAGVAGTLFVPGLLALAADRLGWVVWLDVATTSRLLYAQLPSWTNTALALVLAAVIGAAQAARYRRRSDRASFDAFLDRAAGPTLSLPGGEMTMMELTGWFGMVALLGLCATAVVLIHRAAAREAAAALPET
jgi:hypothetical protein